MWVTFPRCSSGIRDEVARDSLPRASARPKVMPRHDCNHRPPRRTQGSVRPAPCRVSDRTMVRIMRPPTLAERPGWIGSSRRGTMRKKTASQTRKHKVVSENQTSGLIAKGKEPRQSVRDRSALDNRSHRTPPPGPLSFESGAIEEGRTVPAASPLFFRFAHQLRLPPPCLGRLPRGFPPGAGRPSRPPHNPERILPPSHRGPPRQR